MSTQPTDQPSQNPALGIALRCAAMLGFAGVSAFAKEMGARGVPLFELIFFRNLFGFIPLCVYIWRTTGFGVLKTRRLGGHLARAVIGLGGMACGFASLHYLSLTDSTAFLFAAPLFMTALSAVLLKEQVGPHRWAAVGVGFLGVLIMARPEPGHFNAPGVALGLLSAVGTAGAMVAIRQIADTEKGPTIVFYYSLAGMAGGLAGAAGHWITPNWTTLALLVVMGLVGGVAQMLLTEALRCASIGVVAPFDYTQFLWAALLGFILWEERLQPATLAGALLVAASGAYILHRELLKFRKG